MSKSTADCTTQTNTRTETHCNILQHTAKLWNTLHHTLFRAATHCNTHMLPESTGGAQASGSVTCNTLQHVATHCNTLQHTATHVRLRSQMMPLPPANCNILQHTSTDCNTSTSKGRDGVPASCKLQQTATDCNRLQQTATDCNRLQQTATDCNRLQDTYV